MNKDVTLQLQQTNIRPGSRLECFNCSLLSSYGFEDERLFVGGQSVYNLTNDNYHLFINATIHFDTIINGAYDKHHNQRKEQ